MPNCLGDTLLPSGGDFKFLPICSQLPGSRQLRPAPPPHQGLSAGGPELVWLAPLCGRTWTLRPPCGAEQGLAGRGLPSAAAGGGPW